MYIGLVCSCKLPVVFLTALSVKTHLSVKVGGSWLCLLTSCTILEDILDIRFVRLEWKQQCLLMCTKHEIIVDFQMTHSNLPRSLWSSSTAQLEPQSLKVQGRHVSRLYPGPGNIQDFSLVVLITPVNKYFATWKVLEVFDGFWTAELKNHLWLFLSRTVLKKKNCRFCVCNPQFQCCPQCK